MTQIPPAPNNVQGDVDVPAQVPPGGQTTFSFTISNGFLGTHNFQWRMVQDGIAWLGDFTPNVPILVVKGS